MKVISLSEAAALISNGDMVAIGGSTVSRAPMSLIFEIIKAGKKGLRVIKTTGGIDIDMLCLAGAVKSVDAGFVGCETAFGLAGHYRAAVQRGEVTANEHACYTVIQALRAAACGAPFMPVTGLVGSDLIKECDYFKVIKSPFGGEDVTVVKAIEPDVGIIHASRCDSRGNSEISGAVYDDALIGRASKKVIVIAEKIIKDSAEMIPSERVHVPGFLVTAAVESPGGAWPCGHYGYYGVSESGVSEILSLESREALSAFIQNNMAREDQSAGRFLQ